MTIQHNTITGSDLHEPKGVAAAAANKVYVSDGSSSGTWKAINHYGGAYLAYSESAPYTLATTTSDQVLNPTLVANELKNFTVTNTPNARITYTGTETIDAQSVITFSTQQESGSGKDAEWAIFKDGTELAGTRSIRSLSSSDWGSITIFANTEMTTGQYLEVKTKILSGTATVEYASFSIMVNGVSV